MINKEVLDQFIYKPTIVCTSPFQLGGIEPPSKFSKKGGEGAWQDLNFERELLEKWGELSSGGGCNFYKK